MLVTRDMLYRGLVLLCLLAAGGCPGELGERTDASGGSQDRGGGGDSMVKSPDSFKFTTDGKQDLGLTPDLPPTNPDAKPPAPDLPPPKPDLPPPKPDSGSGQGGPCPCAAPLICINNKTCRAPCKKPAGMCNATSNCPKKFACLATNVVNMYVCMPAQGAGQKCEGAVYCEDKTVCVKVNKAPYLCLPTCTKLNGACGTTGKGKCAKSGTCQFCTAP